MLEQTLIDYDGTNTYIGRAYAGAETSSPNWAITKIEHDATGKVLYAIFIMKHGLMAKLLNLFKLKL